MNAREKPIQARSVYLLAALVAVSLSGGEARASGKAIAMTSPALPDGRGASARDNGTASAETDRRRARAIEFYQSGLSARKSGDRNKALIDLLKATREDPKFVDAYYEQALLFRDQKFHKLAISRLEQALAIDPQYQPARILLATIKLEQGNVSDAAELLGKTLGIEIARKQTDEEVTPVSVLQTIHEGIPRQARTKTDTTGSARQDQDSAPALEAAAPAQPAPAPPPARKRAKKSTRQKIRQALAKRYNRFHKKNKRVHHRKPWIARVFSLPEPFKHGFFTGGPSPTPVEPENQGLDLTPSTEPRAEPIAEVPVQPEPEPVEPVEPPRTETARTETARTETAAASDSTAKVLANLELPFSIEDLHKNLVSSDWLMSALPRREAPRKPAPGTKEPVKAKAPAQPPAEDEWTVRLRYLKEHGTSSLKEGEAFMFAEDTGEAVLFLAGGKKIRRVIAQPQTEDEIVKARRPDILVPKELLYDLSLLGKVVDEEPSGAGIADSLPPSSPSIGKSAPDREPPRFRMERLYEEPNGFVDWLKGFIRM
ncbi:MAG: tetratricopeptide repeat protein [Candidatus Obscuribacterales bacterium]